MNTQTKKSAPIQIVGINRTQANILNKRIQNAAFAIQRADQIKIRNMQDWTNYQLNEMTWRWIKPILRFANKRGWLRIPAFFMAFQGIVIEQHRPEKSGPIEDVSIFLRGRLHKRYSVPENNKVGQLNAKDSFFEIGYRAFDSLP